MVIDMMFNNLWNETLTAWRGMLRRPGFALLATVTLSLGIASSVISFGLIERLLMQPLPFPEERALYAAGLEQGNGSNGITPAEYRAVQALELEVDLGLVSLSARGGGAFRTRVASDNRF